MDRQTWEADLDERQDEIMIKVNSIIEDARLATAPVDEHYINPTFDTLPNSVVIPSVFPIISHTEPLAELRYNTNPSVRPEIVYPPRTRLNLINAPSNTLTLRAQATSPNGFNLSEIVTKAYTCSISWSEVWNLDTDLNNYKGAIALTNIGGVTFNTSPNLNSATFNGTSILHSSSLTGMVNSAFTISCWAKPVTVATYTAVWMFEQISSGSDGAGVVVFADGSVFLQILQSNGTYITAQTAPGYITLGTMYHFVLSANGTTIKLYVNGTEALSASYNNTIDATRFERFIIGGERGAGAGAVVRGFIGSIDRLYYINTGLTAPQVASLYAQDVYAKL